MWNVRKTTEEKMLHWTAMRSKKGRNEGTEIFIVKQ
jgi:hypothetical protein